MNRYEIVQMHMNLCSTDKGYWKDRLGQFLYYIKIK